MKHDKEMVLFEQEQKKITYGNFVDALFRLDAPNCDVLFVHSDLSFGRIAHGLKRNELMNCLLDALLETKVKTLMFPTFTFSFCNQEVYDVDSSKTAMGMFPEYVRKREDSYRTDDPILSATIIGDKQGFETMNGTSSCGTGGIFHQLHTCGKKVKFLFFGTSAMKCFTYLHYVEEVKHVPYRYLKDFTGNVIMNGKTIQKTVKVNVRYKDVIATLPPDFASGMTQNGIMKTVSLGASSISVVDEEKSFTYISKLIEDNPYVFSILPESGKLEKEFQYGNVTTM